MKKYKDFGIYDFSDYAEEITGVDLIKINGGATSCSNEAPPASPAPKESAPAQTTTTTTTTTTTPAPAQTTTPSGYNPGPTPQISPNIPEEIKSNPYAYAAYMAKQGQAKAEGEPERYKGYNVLGGGNTLVNVITSYDKTKDIEYIVKEIKERISYDLDLMNYVKKNTKIVIERSPKDNGPNGDYYKSTLKIQMGEIVFFEGKVQSTADGASTGPGKTIPLGNYTGELYNKSESYLNAIHLKSNDKNIVIDNDIFIHPDARTALGFYNSYSKYNKPCSQGCPIEKYETFGSMTFAIKELGFKYGACTSINSGVMGDTIPVLLTKGN